MDQQQWLGIADDEFQFRHGQAHVQRYPDRADAEGRELRLDHVGGVGAEHGDAVAPADTARTHGRRRATHALVHLRVGEAALRREIDQRGMLAAHLGMMRDPVEIQKRHRFLPGAVDRASIVDLALLR